MVEYRGDPRVAYTAFQTQAPPGIHPLSPRAVNALAERRAAVHEQEGQSEERVHSSLHCIFVAHDPRLHSARSGATRSKFVDVQHGRSMGCVAAFGRLAGVQP